MAAANMSNSTIDIGYTQMMAMVIINIVTSIRPLILGYSVGKLA
jgi:hypothetical protein